MKRKKILEYAESGAFWRWMSFGDKMRQASAAGNHAEFMMYAEFAEEAHAEMKEIQAMIEKARK